MEKPEDLLDLDLLADCLTRHTSFEEDPERSLVAMGRADFSLDLFLASTVDHCLANESLGLVFRVHAIDDDDHLVARRLVDTASVVVDCSLHTLSDLASLYKRFLSPLELLGPWQHTVRTASDTTLCLYLLQSLFGGYLHAGTCLRFHPMHGLYTESSS
jgi:hypothetical protein